MTEDSGVQKEDVGRWRTDLRCDYFTDEWKELSGEENAQNKMTQLLKSSVLTSEGQLNFSNFNSYINKLKISKKICSWRINSYSWPSNASKFCIWMYRSVINVQRSSTVTILWTLSCGLQCRWLFHSSLSLCFIYSIHCSIYLQAIFKNYRKRTCSLVNTTQWIIYVSRQ